MGTKTVRIGGASGFWGDTAVAAPELVRGGDLDYLVFDYLAEITLSIMARMRAKDPAAGYAVDFVSVTMKRLIRDLAAQGIRVVSNAGGVNPAACGAAVQALADEAGLDLKVAVVEGDDLMAREVELRAAAKTEMFSGAAFPESCWSLNAYLGALPIKAALDAGADIVITGRGVDSAVTLGPLMHEFGWQPDDHDLLAAGSLAGHIIECGAQATGGLFTDWRDVPDWDRIGYPVVAVRPDGRFTVEKPPGSGGLVSVGTIAEQILYEIGDPQRYILPDVVADFSGVHLEELGDDRVAVSGARGAPPTPDYKVSATYQAGYRATAMLTIGGREAAPKARKTAAAILARTRRMLAERNLGDYAEVNVEVMGAEAMYGPLGRAEAAREVVLKIAAAHHDKRALELFSREVAPAGTSMAQGTTGFFGGRPKVQPIIRLFSFLTPKRDVAVRVRLGEAVIPVEIPADGGFDSAAVAAVTPVAAEPAAGPTVTVPLIRLAWARSGDKGNAANIGVIARDPTYLGLIRDQVTPAAVKAYLGHLVEGPVERFDLPGFHAVNFLLHEALGGGGIASLRMDAQGKAYGQMLLDLPVQVPVAWGLAEAAA